MHVLTHGFLLSLHKAFFSWEALCYESFFVSHDVSINCMMELRNSLNVSILHPRHHSSWIGILHSLKVLHQWCRCIHHIHLELSSLVLWNKSHPSLFVGDFTRSFLQVKCISWMIRNISSGIFIMKNYFASIYMIMKLFYPI